jgi:cell division protein FtsA
MFLVITADNEEVNNLKYCLEQCGLQVKQIILEPLASADAVLASDEKQLGVALIDIGSGTSDMVIYHNNEIVAVNMLAHGGHLVTRDIAQVLHLTELQGEKLKVEHGSCICTPRMKDNHYTIPVRDDEPAQQISAELLSQIIRARMEQIIKTIDNNISESGYSDVVNRIVFTGGGAALRRLDIHAAYKLGCSVRIGEPIIEEEGKEDMRRIHSRCATCVGLTFAADHCSAKKSNNIIDRWIRIREKAKQKLVDIFFNEPELEACEM